MFKITSKFDLVLLIISSWALGYSNFSRFFMFSRPIPLDEASADGSSIEFDTLK